MSDKGTIPLYQREQTLTSCQAKLVSCQAAHECPENVKKLFVLSAESSSDTVLISTDQTVFHPQGGGQPSDTGIFTDGTRKFRVSRVRKHPDPAQANDILHCGTMEPPGADTWLASDQVTQRIAARRRILHSRLHTAGHILGVAVKALSTRGEIPPIVELKANHYPDSSLDEFRGRIDGSAKEAIQREVDKLVDQDLRVLVRHWTPEEANAKCASVPEGGLKVGMGEDGSEASVRIVEIEDTGSYPCGGTHLPTTGDVGKVIVRNIRRNKDITKITYKIGNTPRTSIRDKEAKAQDQEWMPEDEMKETEVFFQRYFEGGTG